MSGVVGLLKIQHGCLTKKICISYDGNNYFSSYRIFTKRQKKFFTQITNYNYIMLMTSAQKYATL